jgi:hypothetical protein
MSISSISSYNQVSSSYTSPIVPQTTSPYSNVQASSYSMDSVSLLATSSDRLAIFAAGGVTGYKHSGVVNESLTSIGNSIKSGSPKEMIGAVSDSFKSLGQASLSAAGVGALIGGGVSLAKNTVMVARGGDFGSATANFFTDTLKGAAGGVGGVFGGGISSMAFKAIGFTGAPLTIVTVLGGAVGAAFASKAINSSGIENKIRNAVA